MTSSDHILMIDGVSNLRCLLGYPASMPFQISAVPVLHNAPRQTKWPNRKDNTSLAAAEVELKEETTTGTTPYASKFPWPILLHKAVDEASPFSRYPIPIFVVRPTCFSQPCLSLSRSTIPRTPHHRAMLQTAHHSFRNRNYLRSRRPKIGH